MSTIAEVERTSTFSALRARDFRIFWAATTAPNLGEWMQVFGVGYLVVQLALRDGSPRLAPFYAGLFGLSQAIPGLTFGLFGGVIADRFDRKRVLAVSELGLSAVTFVLAVLTMSDRIDIAQVLVIAALIATIRAFDDPCRYALVPNLVPRGCLVSAVGLYSASYNGAQLLGPVLGGLLYVPMGVGGLFLVQSLAYLVLPAALLVIHPVVVAGTGARRAQAERAEERPGPIRSMREGLGHIVRDPVILWVFVLCAASQFLVRPYTQLLPSFAEGVLHVGAVQLSWLLTASGAGALVGALVIASLGSLERRGRFLVVAGVGLGLAVVLLASQRALVGAIGTLAALGFMVLMFQGTVNTTVQLRAPDHLRGRVLSVLLMIPLGVMPLGISALGFVGSATGVAVSMGVAGVVFAVLALSGRLLARDLWGWVDNRRRHPPSPGVAADDR